ncbi:hypothetical protein [Campylobacter lari]|nr:hypothetical protein [Campylobacter lari]MCR2075873.1 hypothetical protein [Campylobacter lari subsp. concheus]MCR2083908.1 hypothetical protein [Campylobacter lari subsp. concheus]MCR2085533.1 hypothetical protein [Campylobacter lari subsp. concheus]
MSSEIKLLKYYKKIGKLIAKICKKEKLNIDNSCYMITLIAKEKYNEHK